MEKLVNCNIFIKINIIDRVTGGNQYYEIYFKSEEQKPYKLEFDYVWDIRCGIENAYIDRFINFSRDVGTDSSILLVKNSEYIKYFKKQVSGTLPTDALKNYILFDSVDTVIEILTLKEPKIVEL